MKIFWYVVKYVEKFHAIHILANSYPGKFYPHAMTFLISNKNAFQEDEYRSLFTIRGGHCPEPPEITGRNMGPETEIPMEGTRNQRQTPLEGTWNQVDMK